jgi:sepiapterin reductase
MALENKKTFAVITGASRGIGRTLTEHLAAVLAPGSLLLLISRDEKGLNSLKALVIQRHPLIQISIAPTDLSTCDESTLDQIFTSVLSDLQSFDHAVCVHNVGSLGDASKYCRDLVQMKEVMDYFQLNVASVVVLNALFFRTFRETRASKTVVNITSLCGIEAFPSFSLYSTGKAAREMFFKVFFIH